MHHARDNKCGLLPGRRHQLTQQCQSAGCFPCGRSGTQIERIVDRHSLRARSTK